MRCDALASHRLAAVLLCSLCWTAAAAEDPAKETAEKARAAYRDAQKALTAGRCDQAIPKLEEGLRLLQVPKALLQLGDCYAEQGRYDLAVKIYRHFLASYSEHGSVSRVKEQLEKAEAQLRERPTASPAIPETGASAAPLPRPGAPPSATPSRPAGSAEAQPAKVPETVNPSPAPRGREESAALQPLAPSPTVQPPVSPAIPPAARPAANDARVAGPAPVAGVEKRGHALFWSGLALGAISSGAGLYFGLQSTSARDALAKGSLTTSVADQNVSTLQRDAKLGNVLLLAGAGVLAATVVLRIVDVL
jgi:hypothetical protein